VGTQYRSEIFYHNEEQKKTAEDYIGLMTAEDTFEANCYEDFAGIKIL
jgi:peptide-methionine (S)-S-oxide reductase